MLGKYLLLYFVVNKVKEVNKYSVETQTKTMTQLNVLRDFTFAKTAVMASISDTGEMIALKSVVENLGLNWSAALRTIKANPNFDQLCHLQKALADDGKSREMVCLPPSAFQDWLWGLKQSENLNVQLWEEYKKGLVVHLLMMLKVSLEEVQRLRRVEEKFHLLKKHFALFAEKSEMGSELSKLAKENWR